MGLADSCFSLPGPSLPAQCRCWKQGPWAKAEGVPGQRGLGSSLGITAGDLQPPLPCRLPLSLPSLEDPPLQYRGTLESMSGLGPLTGRPGGGNAAPSFRGGGAHLLGVLRACIAS